MIEPVFDRTLTFRRRWKHIPFLILKVIVVPTLRVLLRFKIHGSANVPKHGGALIVGNHIHNSDPILMLSASPRPILWMAKSEVWTVPVIPWFANVAGAFPVERGKADRKAIKQALGILNEGLLVGMYPEGTRTVTGGLKEPFPGVSLVAIRSGAPVIPCVIVGSDSLPLNGGKPRRRAGRWPRVEVAFGPPFHLDTHDADGRRYHVDELTDAMMIEIARMLPEQMRGIYRKRAVASHPAVRRDAIRFTGPQQPGPDQDR